jgi:hypothetical protein
VLATPLVANLTDDNDDGQVDLCDTPDVVVVAFSPDTFSSVEQIYASNARIYILDGETGSLKQRIEDPVTWFAIPALADIDGDGEVEIIAPQSIYGNMMAWNADGTQVSGFDATFVEGPDVNPPTLEFAAPVSVYDLDGDGNPEILLYRYVFDSQGNLLATLDVDTGVPYVGLTVADLDQDGNPEIISGNKAWTWSGGAAVSYYDAAILPGHPQVADLTGDGVPEILVTGSEGFSVLDVNGVIQIFDEQPVMAPTGGLTWQRPATIHDFDGDGGAEFAFSVAQSYLLLDVEIGTGGLAPIVNLLAQWDVLDSSGIAGGTAFDFLGDGSAEAMYADETTLYVWESADASQAPYVAEPRSSRTIVEYPVVADVDNDGSAEIVVVSNESPDGGVESPPVQVYGDSSDRWVPARRIWNQHAYHVTNVYEDGTIPTVHPPYWTTFNSFRTNAQLENGVTCLP